MRCQSHPDVETSCQCTECGIPWCESCVKVIVGRRICPSCGHQVITVDAEALSLGGTFKDIGTRLISFGGLFVSFGIGALSLLGNFSNLFALLHLAAIAGYYFVLIRHVGEGNAKLPGSSDTAQLDWSDIVGYAIRGIMVGVASFLPLIAYLILASTWVLEEIFAMIVIGQLYMPAVVLSVLLSGSWMGALWPVAWFKIMAASPGRYLRFTGIWFATAIAGGLLSTAIIGALPDDLLGAWVSTSLSTWLAFAQAIVVGHYVRENRTAFGWTEAAAVTRMAVPPAPLPVATMRAHGPSHSPIARTHAPTAQPIGLTTEPRDDGSHQPSRRQSRMPSSIPFDDNAVESEPQPPRRDPICYSTQRMSLSTDGIDAIREDGSRCVVAWTAVVGIVARRMPATDADNDILFVDVVSTPGSTLRLVPWTTIQGFQLPATPEDRVRVFIRLVRRYSENARLDGRTHAFVDGNDPPLQLPDAATLAEHDRRLA